MTAVSLTWRFPDKRKFLQRSMELLAGEAHISFEGNFKNLKLSEFPCSLETDLLKRNTISPRQDFVILPLEPELVGETMSVIGGTVPGAILHIQIEKSKQLELGLYDNFHLQCIYFGTAFTPQVLDSLLADGLLIRRSREQQNR